MRMTMRRLWWGRWRARLLLRRPPVLAACCLLISCFLLLKRNETKELKLIPHKHKYVNLASVLVVDRAEPASHASLVIMGEQDFPRQSNHSLPKSHHNSPQNHHFPPPPSSPSMASPPPSRSPSLALTGAGPPSPHSQGGHKALTGAGPPSPHSQGGHKALTGAGPPSPQPQGGHKALKARGNIVEQDFSSNNVHQFDAQKSRVSQNGSTNLKANTNSKIRVMENYISLDSGKEGKTLSSPGPNKTSSPKNGWLDVVQGLVQGEKTLNPGMLLGAVAALKKLHSAGDADDSPLKPVMGVVQAVKQAIFPQPQESRQALPDSQGFLKPEFKYTETKIGHLNITENRTQLLGKRIDFNELDAKDSSLHNKLKSSSPNNDIKQGIFNPGSIQNAVGVIGSLLGQGHAGKPGSQSMVGSLMINLASPLLAGAFSNNNNKAGTSPSLIQSLVNGLGPVLQNGIIQQGFRGGNSAPRNSIDRATSSPLQSFISKMGPSLLAGAVQHGLSAMQGGQNSHRGDQNSSPLQSVLSGLAPALIAGLTQGNTKRGQMSPIDNVSQNFNPIQSIIFGLAPALVAGALQQGFGNALTKSSADAGKLSHSQPLMNGLRSTNSLTTMQAELGRSGRALQVVNSEMKRRLREFSSRPEDDNAGETFHDTSGETFHDTAADTFHDNAADTFHDNAADTFHDTAADTIHDTAADTFHDTTADTFHDNNSRVRNVGQANAAEIARNNENEKESQEGLVRLLTKAVVGNLLPEELPVPEPNSTRGAWNMAVNLAFGNPKDDNGRKSGFWKWLREYGGGASGAPTPPQWITDALHNPQRAAHAIEIGRVFEMMEVPQPICTNVKSVGGVFNWKTNVLDGARAVCMDADVSPKRENCVVYSFGIRGRLTFEEDMERMGCKVWVFDPSVQTDSEHRDSHLHFHSVGLAPINTTRLLHGKEWTLLPFSSVVEQMGHQTTTIDYLKLDIQGDEWEVLQEVMRNNMHTLTNVKQLGLEAHLDGALHDPALYKVYLDTFLGLESFGFQLFYSNENEREWRSFEDPLLKRRVSPTYDLAFLRI